MKTFKQFNELSKSKKPTGAEKGVRRAIESLLDNMGTIVGGGSIGDKAFVTVKVKPEDEKSIIKKLKKAGFDAHMTGEAKQRLMQIMRGGNNEV